MVSHVTFALLVSLVAVSQAQDLNIPGLGEVQGITTKSAWSERNIYEYRGIPYAEAPIGDNRFKYPIEKAPWEGESFNAKESAQQCPQPEVSMLKGLGGFLEPDDEIKASQKRRAAARADLDPEDCLTLDVHSPTGNSSAMLPVVVYFHGGGFLTGSSAALRPGYLLEKDIVLVTPQYRLGPLGYFYQNTEDAPGNMGLMDQKMALEWVHKYIWVFGGNPEQVTVAGSSAGGASASLQMLSPEFNMETDRLFNRVISTSGAALALWAIETDNGLQQSTDMAANANCTETDPSDLMDCMRNLTLETLMTSFLDYHVEQRKMGLLGMGSSIPVVQQDGMGYTPILTASPQEILENGTYNPVPLFAGATLNEGIYMLDATYQGYLKPNEWIEDEQFMKTEIVPAILFAYGVDENSRVMADACVRRYFIRDDMGDFEKMIPSLIDFEGVTFMKGSIFRQAELHSLKAKTFLYSFDYYGAHTLFKKTEDSIDVNGALTHADDTIYIFPSGGRTLNENDEVIAKRMIDLYANFIIHGHPTPAGHEVEGIPDFISYHREQGAYLSMNWEATVRSNYRNSFTSALDNGLKGTSAASAMVITPILLLAAAAAVLMQ